MIKVPKRENVVPTQPVTCNLQLIILQTPEEEMEKRGWLPLICVD